MEWVYGLDELEQVAAQVWNACRQRKVWALEGSMGAGKTTFIVALCQYLQVTGKAGSPTYSLINEYRSSAGETFYHMDLYRLRDEEEALAAGVEECLYSNCYCFVEWAGKAAGLLPDDVLYLSIILEADGKRRLKAAL
jgi:tRNA threonylcarbamoyladenosine biosynthesis protein TsaE